MDTCLSWITIHWKKCPGDQTTENGTSQRLRAVPRVVITSYSTVDCGAGAPLHTQETDELIVILRETVKVRLGGQTESAGPNHTVVILPSVPHDFTNSGNKPLYILTFFPTQNPFNRTTFIDGPTTLIWIS